MYRSVVFCGSHVSMRTCRNEFRPRRILVICLDVLHRVLSIARYSLYCTASFNSIPSLDRVYVEDAVYTATSDHSGALPDDFASPPRWCAIDDDDCDGDDRARRRREDVQRDSPDQQEIHSDQQDQEQSSALQSLRSASSLSATTQEDRLEPPTNSKQPAPPIFDLVIDIDDLDRLDP